jgi:hypothetical protein
MDMRAWKMQHELATYIMYPHAMHSTAYLGLVGCVERCGGERSGRGGSAGSQRRGALGRLIAPAVPGFHGGVQWAYVDLPTNLETGTHGWPRPFDRCVDQFVRTSGWARPYLRKTRQVCTLGMI